ncbi:MAG TPA: TRAP transporter substrate-binding protein [Stellaceae bacterium]|nr:TRAP transporter substrate-binding protein [Stellaceae bacterium]
MPSRPIEIRLGGYGPATTTFSRALKLIGDRLKAAFGDGVEIRFVWNIMDFGYKSEDILWLVESGVLTLGYQSSSYFTDRVPEIGLLDLPFLFATRQTARAAMDGPLGTVMAGKIEAGLNHRILGYFENGFRHVSNRLRPVRRPTDLAGMTIRMLPSDIQVRTFELLGAVPLRMDLTEAIERIRAGTIDAQENPLANTVTYGVHKFHRFHSLTSHFYLSRPIFVHRPSYDAWPRELQQAMAAAVREAVTVQRDLAIAEEEKALAEIKSAGCEVLTLNATEHAAFVAAVQPLRADAQKLYSAELLSLIP